MEAIHTPVLLQECLELLAPYGDEKTVMCDSTLGEGGHSFAFLSQFPNSKVIGIDADAGILARAKERLECFAERTMFYNGWFDDFYASYPADFPKPDIILFDLGISMYHYELSGRGFSFRHDEALDMRLTPSEGKSAADIVNGTEEGALADLIYRWGEEKLSRSIARAIVKARASGEIRSSKALADIIYDAVPLQYRHGSIHPATRTFQALRIAVNGELARLPRSLHDAFNDLKAGGKMGVITFHSLEDRIVKNYFRNLGKSCVCPPEVPACRCGGTPCAEVLTKKPVSPSAAEVSVNSPSRSAKLRVVRKLRDAEDARCLGTVV